MADENNEIHYLVGTQDEPVAHIYAKDQEAAIKEFCNGGNWNGYDADEFDGTDVIIVPFSKTDTYVVEVVPPTKMELELRKLSKT